MAQAKGHEEYATRHLADSVTIPGAFCAAYLTGLVKTPRRVVDLVRSGDTLGACEEFFHACFFRPTGTPFGVLDHSCTHARNAYKQFSKSRQLTGKAEKYDAMCDVLQRAIEADAAGKEAVVRALCRRVNQLEAEIKGNVAILPTRQYSPHLRLVREPARTHTAGSTDLSAEFVPHLRAQFPPSDDDLRASDRAWRKWHRVSTIAADLIHGGPGINEDPRRQRFSPVAHRLMDGPQKWVDKLIGDTSPSIAPHPASPSSKNVILRPDDHQKAS